MRLIDSGLMLSMNETKSCPPKKRAASTKANHTLATWCGTVVEEEVESMRRNNYPLRLQRTLMEEARKAAASEGVSLNQLINVAVAEKVSALRTEIYLHERIRRAYQEEQLRLLDRALMEDRSLEGDEPLNRGLQEFGEKPQPEVQPAPTADSERPGVPGGPYGWATPQFGKLKKRLERMVPR
jgi:predicted HicB family RNase H-like nuclease